MQFEVLSLNKRNLTLSSDDYRKYKSIGQFQRVEKPSFSEIAGNYLWGLPLMTIIGIILLIIGLIPYGGLLITFSLAYWTVPIGNSIKIGSQISSFNKKHSQILEGSTSYQDYLNKFNNAFK